MTNTAAENLLKGTVAADKNEMLFTRFGINYNDEPEIFRKGSVVFRHYQLEEAQGHIDDSNDKPNEADAQQVSKSQAERARKAKAKAKVVVEHIDIIKDDFWDRRPWIVTGKAGSLVTEARS